jgi:hypothetical protein
MLPLRRNVLSLADDEQAEACFPSIDCFNGSPLRLSGQMPGAMLAERIRMKATTLLKRQHNEVKAIFKKLEKGVPNAPALLQTLANDLCAHMAIEQDIFYPAIKSIDEDLVRESYEEHSIAEFALKRLLETDPGDPSFKAHVTSTKELIEHHVEEEEEELSPKVERKVKDSQLNVMGEQMKARFEAVVKEGFDATVPKGLAKTSSDLALRHLSEK